MTDSLRGTISRKDAFHGESASRGPRSWFPHDPRHTATSDWYSIRLTAGSAQQSRASVYLDASGLHVFVHGLLGNRSSLSRELGVASLTSGELIAVSYRRWGLRFPARLSGAFFIVLVDPAESRILLVSDPLNQRPAYYRTEHGTLYFSTQIMDLLPSTPNLKINGDRVTEFLTPIHVIDEGWWDPDASFFRGIDVLPHASLWVVEPPCRIQADRYWYPPSVDRSCSKETCLESFRQTFLEVIEDYVQGFGTIGADLSGGLDSTSVAFAARHLLGSAENEARLRTYTLSFDHPDSRHDTKRVKVWLARYKDMEGRILWGDHYRGPLECGQYAEYSPLSNPTLMALPEGFVHLQRCANEDGCEILLTGEGSDYYLAGSDLIWDSLVKSRNLPLFGRSLLELSRRGAAHLVASYLLRFAVVPLLPRPWALKGYVREHYRDTLEGRFPDVFTKDFEHRLQSLTAEQRSSLLSYRGRADCWGARLDEELLFPPYIVSAGIPTDLEVLSPYLDVRLLNVGLRTPPEYKFDLSARRQTYYASSKILQREGLRGIVPDDVLDNEKKALYGPSMRKRLESHFAKVFKDPAESLLVENTILDGDALCRVVASLDEEGYKIVYPDFMWWDALLALELWLRTVRSRVGATEIA